MTTTLFAFDELVCDPKREAQIRSYKTFGDDWAESAIRQQKAEQWRDTYLNVETESAQTYRCCVEGVHTYTRKDGAKLTQDDIDAVQFRVCGQANGFTVSPDGFSIAHKWLCDSSD